MTALVFGILGVVIPAFIPFSTLGIIFGAIARGEAKGDPSLGGHGMATAGLVLGMIGLVLAPVWIVLLYA